MSSSYTGSIMCRELGIIPQNVKCFVDYKEIKVVKKINESSNKVDLWFKWMHRTLGSGIWNLRAWESRYIYCLVMKIRSGSSQALIKKEKYKWTVWRQTNSTLYWATRMNTCLLNIAVTNILYHSYCIHHISKWKTRAGSR